MSLTKRMMGLDDELPEVDAEAFSDLAAELLAVVATDYLGMAARLR